MARWIAGGAKEHWREVGYWIWLWRNRLPSETKMVICALVVAGVAGGGWLAADRLTAAEASVADTEPYVLETTVRKLITVRQQGQTVRKLVPVVKRVKVFQRGSTRYLTRVKYSTRVVTAPAQLRTVRRTVKALVPVVTTRVVRANGKAKTVAKTVLVPTTKTETQTKTVTETQNVVQPASTVTATKTSTVSQTQTVTQTQTQIQTQTQTVTKTETITLPGETIVSTTTVTVTRPKP